MPASDPHQAKVWNEKIKLLTTTISNAGLALLAWGSASFYQQFSFINFFWAAAGIITIIVSLAFVDGMQPE